MNFPFPITEAVRHAILIFSCFGIAFFLAIIMAKPFIQLLLKYRIGKQIRETATDGKSATLYHQLHAKKQGTPTMGGILIWGTSLIVVLLTRVGSFFGLFDHSILNRKETYLPLFTLIAVGLLGALDDYLNIKGVGKTKGMAVKPKFLWLILLAALGAFWFYFKLGYNNIHVPGIGDFGLAGGLIVIAFASFGAIAYMKGLLILTAFCGIIAGASLGFLWFNIPPAKVFMGDTGSLALGATLGVIAMLTNSVLILPFIGFIFVIETLSVILQLSSKKLFHRKIFLIAPLHHHLEQIGWPEQQVTMRLWMIGSIVAMLGLILGLIGMGL
ncbi:MAG: Phospho-N-acetylmuramoyl-pentapeptide-transferase [Candidatus Peregrinibacteria bacterium GW2011_GWA2_44_7]|nr:MAG: Phospho-N-acetylmuramoyl-pentapeptide-transferase [Candidatus Peregrinibacteria bacterium GW2011_GWA2_44_7]